MILMLLAAAAATPDTVIGRWKTETRNGVVEIARCGTSLCGRLVTSDGLRADPNLLDERNKDPKLRTRRLAGVPLLGGFARAGDRWDGGWIYKADDGNTYKSTITPLGPDRLEVKGCWLFLCRSQTWTRVG